MATPPPPPPSPTTTNNSTTSLARLIRTTLTYDTNVMLAAIISLLLVILFVLLLHLYTRWFLLQARRRSHSSVTVPRVLGSRLHQRFTIIDTTNSDHSSGKLGLPISIISSLPLFVYESSPNEDRDRALECSICLCLFEDEEIGRKLPTCGHAFHVECIDMWLHSHSTCPICRAGVQCNHIRKIDQLEIEVAEIADPGRNAIGLTINNTEDLCLEIATISNHVGQPGQPTDVVSSSSVGESQSSNKLLNSSSSSSSNSSSSSSSSSRSGGKVHPSSVVNVDESEA